MNLNDVTAMKFGTVDVQAVYLGQAKLWPPVPPDPKGFTAIYEQGEDVLLNPDPTWWVLIKGTATADYSLMFRPGPNPADANGYPAITPDAGAVYGFSSLTPVPFAVSTEPPVPVPITAGMTARQIGAAIKAAWNNVVSTPHAIMGGTATLAVNMFPPIAALLGRIPARVRAAFGTFDITQDCVLMFKSSSPLNHDSGFLHFSPLVAWRQDANGNWVEI
jgi:hypothetical protein